MIVGPVTVGLPSTVHCAQHYAAGLKYHWALDAYNLYALLLFGDVHRGPPSLFIRLSQRSQFQMQ